MKTKKPKFQNFKMIPHYSDYGDVTGIQTIRRWINFFNEYVDEFNQTVIEFIDLYTDLSEMMDKQEALLLAFRELVQSNEEFKLEVKQMLEDWINDPRLAELINNVLFDEKLDKSEFTEFANILDEQLKDIAVEIEKRPIADVVLEWLREKVDTSYFEMTTQQIMKSMKDLEIKIDKETKTKTYVIPEGTSHNDMQTLFNYIGNKIILFGNGRHVVNNIRINANTTVIAQRGARIVTEGQNHTFLNFRNDSDSYRGFNGEGNILIKGGTYVNASLPIFHTKNFKIESVIFDGTEKSHYIQLCAVNNFTVDSCEFIGQPLRQEGRQYIEMIQLDNCKYENFPYLDNKESPAYDGTGNKNVFIKNNVFTNKAGHQFYCAFGSHTGYANEYHENIHFTDNFVSGTTFSVVQGSMFRGLNILRNKIHYAKGYTFKISGDSQNVNIVGNTVNNSNQLYYGVQRGVNFVNGLNISENIFQNQVVEHGVTNEEYDQSSYGVISLTNYLNANIINNTFRFCEGYIYNEYGASSRNEGLKIDNNKINNHSMTENRIVQATQGVPSSFHNNTVTIKSRDVGALSIARLKEAQTSSMYGNSAVALDGKTFGMTENEISRRDFSQWKTFESGSAKQTITSKIGLDAYDTVQLKLGTVSSGTLQIVEIVAYQDHFGDGAKGMASCINNAGELSKVKMSVTGDVMTVEVDGGYIDIRGYQLISNNKNQTA